MRKISIAATDISLAPIRQNFLAKPKTGIIVGSFLSTRFAAIGNTFEDSSDRNGRAMIM